MFIASVGDFLSTNPSCVRAPSQVFIWLFVGLHRTQEGAFSTIWVIHRWSMMSRVGRSHNDWGFHWIFNGGIMEYTLW